MMWEIKVARIKNDEYIILRLRMEEGEVREMEYLDSELSRSRWKTDAKVYFTKDDAISDLLIKRMRGEETSEKKPETQFQKEYESWSQLLLHG